MKKFIFVFLFSFLVIYGQKEIYIAAAAGYKLPVQEIIGNFRKVSDIKVNCIFGNMKQISTYIDRSDKISLVLGDEAFLDKLGIEYIGKKALGRGRLILIHKGKEEFDMENLKKEEIKTICIPDPKKAIYGKAAVQCLEYYDVFEEIKDKLIIVKTVSQVSAYMINEEADIGLINLTDYSKMKESEIKKYNIDLEAYEKINIEFRMLAEEGEELYKYFDNDKSKEILKRYGL
jgi:molybdate transport system substrate-binding protein